MYSLFITDRVISRMGLLMVIVKMSLFNKKNLDHCPKRAYQTALVRFHMSQFRTPGKTQYVSNKTLLVKLLLDPYRTSITPIDEAMIIEKSNFFTDIFKRDLKTGAERLHMMSCTNS